jgi:adenosyl cobinamide kinase/adenosyl cobinamide phosphate guanylyltransferase/glycosyltransferase involved in cell wall biosynthesis
VLIVLLGGARSGKSATAERWARAHADRGGSVTVVATGEPLDAEMAERIDTHRADRPAGWQTLEEPLDLAGAIAGAPPHDLLVVDCLTTWLGNLFHHGLVAETDARLEGTLDAIRARSGTTVAISNEVGWGMVPADAMTRDYRDRLGRINQRVVAASDQGYLVVAGRALRLEQLTTRSPDTVSTMCLAHRERPWRRRCRLRVRSGEALIHPSPGRRRTLIMRTQLLDLAVEPDVVTAMRIAESVRERVPLATEAEWRLLLGAMVDDDPVLAIGSVHAAAVIASPVADRALTEALGDPRPWVREHAAWALGGRRPTAAAIGGLIDLHATGTDLTAMVAQRTLAGWSRSAGADVSDRVQQRLLTTADPVVRRRLVDTLGTVRRADARAVLADIALDGDEHLDVRVAAVDAFAGHDDATPLLLQLVDDDSPVATAALLAMVDMALPTPAGDGRAGLRVGQLSLTGRMDAALSAAGAGDTGGIARLLVAVSHGLVGRDEIDSVLTIGRSTLAGELGSLLEPDLDRETFASVSLGALDSTPSIATEWDHRLRLERGIRRVLVRRPPLDVLHLRMADVGTLAAAAVARRLGVGVVFTCAPDPHAPVAQRQAAGELTRETFGAVDLAEHLWFRVRMVERLAHQADHLVLFPRADSREALRRLTAIDRTVLDDRSTVAPEGIDLANIEAAEERIGESPVIDDLVAALPADRHGLPLVVSVGRLHPVKGMVRVVADWLGDPFLRTTTNLVIVGGDLAHPNAVERQVLDQIAELLADTPDAAGVVLLGSRDPAATAHLLVVATRGVGDVVAPGGVYVNGAAKEEFGLALLEALASGLPVVAPSEGGPRTYVERGVTGVLVPPTGDLAPAIHEALALHHRPGRAAAARCLVEERYTVDAYAEALGGAYVAATATALTR